MTEVYTSLRHKEERLCCLSWNGLQGCPSNRILFVYTSSCCGCGFTFSCCGCGLAQFACLILCITYRPDLRTSLALLDHTLHLSGAALLETSAHAVFLSLPHRCPLLEPVDLSPRPCVPSLAEFLEHVQRKVASESFRWWGGGEEEGNRAGSAESSSALQFAMSAQWTFGRVMSSEFSTPQVY